MPEKDGPPPPEGALVRPAPVPGEPGPGLCRLRGLYGAHRLPSTGTGRAPVTVCYLLGMARNERLCDYVLRPLAQDPALRH